MPACAARLALTVLAACCALLAGCQSLREEPPSFPQSGSSTPRPGQPPQPVSPQAGQAGQATPGSPEAAQPPAQPPRPAKQYRLGAASSALVAQAHKQLVGGDFGLAAATIERAMRIEPDNPLLWIELGRVRYTAGDVSQADSMGRKALALATGDPQAQALAWRLRADSLRSLRRNEEAADADRRAEGLSPR